uniref:Uncharacterized protein n=1 Tax=Micrurus corallinus TaxID=54390 RepID=A0A2D4F0R6_MICCO
MVAPKKITPLSPVALIFMQQRDWLGCPQQRGSFKPGHKGAHPFPPSHLSWDSNLALVLLGLVMLNPTPPPPPRFGVRKQLQVAEDEDNSVSAGRKVITGAACCSRSPPPHPAPRCLFNGLRCLLPFRVHLGSGDDGLRLHTGMAWKPFLRSVWSEEDSHGRKSCSVFLDGAGFQKRPCW